jgi:hypothetical protein
MTVYDDIAGDWELEEWTDRIDCESGFGYSRSRTQEFTPFHLDLDYPPAGAPTGTFSTPDTGAQATFEWVLFGNPAAAIRFRDVEGGFHGFERTYDMRVSPDLTRLVLKRCWTFERWHRAEGVVDEAIDRFVGGYFRFWGFAGPLGLIIGTALLVALLPVMILARAVDSILTSLFGTGFETCTHCEKIVFRRRPPAGAGGGEGD